MDAFITTNAVLAGTTAVILAAFLLTLYLAPPWVDVEPFLRQRLIRSTGAFALLLWLLFILLLSQ